MRELLSNWAITNLGTICGKGQYGWTTKASDQGSVKYLRTTDITKASINWESVPYCQETPLDLDKYLIRANDILISRAGSVGFSTLIALPPSPTVFASYLIRYVPCECVVPKFVAYFLHSVEYWNQIGLATSGIALANVNATKLADVVVPLAPFNEQKRIADKLDAILARVDACRERLDRIPGILKRFRQAVLAAATSGKLTEDWGENSCNESSWQGINVGELLIDIRYGTAKKCHYEPQATPVIRIPNICDGKISHIDLKYAEFDDDERQKLSLVTGDILMIRSNGSVDLVGRTALATEADEGFLYAGYLIRLRVNQQIVDPAYLSLALSAPDARHAIELTARSTSGVNNINTEEIKAIGIKLPNLTEQNEIVRRIESLFAYADRLEVHYAAARAQVDKLTPAILARAFRGELVPQDPNDEPASVLLERIKANRANDDAKPKRASKSNTNRVLRKLKETTTMTMTKSRQDDDVKGKFYLAEHLRNLGGSAQVEVLFEVSDLPVADFYKQLAWEIAEDMIRDAGKLLEIGDAA